MIDVIFPLSLTPSLFICFVYSILLYLNFYFRFLITHNKVEALRRQSLLYWLWGIHSLECYVPSVPSINVY